MFASAASGDDAGLAGSSVITPERFLRQAHRVDFTGHSRIAVTNIQAESMLQFEPQASAGGLYFAVDPALQCLDRVNWRWIVNPLQTTADLRQPSQEDVGATVMFVFGEPSLLSRDVPTLAYAWSATPVPDLTVLPSLRFGSLSYVQLRGRGDAPVVTAETRSLANDFEHIFHRPRPPLHYIVLFNDNDQTREPVRAGFGAFAMSGCGTPG